MKRGWLVLAAALALSGCAMLERNLQPSEDPYSPMARAGPGPAPVLPPFTSAPRVEPPAPPPAPPAPRRP